MIVVDEAGAAWRAGPSPERGDYPVGSGDAALAGFLAAIADGATTAQAARHAVAAGTANALQPGQAQIDPGDAARILPGVTLESIGAGSASSRGGGRGSGIGLAIDRPRTGPGRAAVTARARSRRRSP